MISADGVAYLCAACKVPIIRGTRCTNCWRGWLVIPAGELISDGADEARWRPDDVEEGVR